MTEETKTEETVEVSDLAKALGDLDELINKGQITTGPGSSKGAMKEEPQNVEDHIKDGTDYEGKKETKKSLEEAVSKANDEGAKEEDEEELEGNEEKAVKKAKEPVDDEEEKVVKKAGGEEDEEEKKALPSAGKEELMSTSGDYTPPGKQPLKKSADEGLDVTEFLYELTHALNKALIGMEARIEDKIQKSHGNQGDLSKAMAESLSGLGSQIQERLDAVEEIEKSAARAPKSVMKAGERRDDASADISKGLDKKEILDRLWKGIKEGDIPATALIGYESTGQIHPEILKSIGIESAVTESV